jgi:carbamate kinase
MSQPPLTVVALGGNAISPPQGNLAYATERLVIQRAMAEVATLALDGARLLIVHGNGPQVGRLLADSGDIASLDVHVAQTQGELGYLLAETLDVQLGDGNRSISLVTRVMVDPDDPAFRHPTKPVGALLPNPPRDLPSVHLAGGWRRVVPSPRPVAVIEQEAIRELLGAHHVIAAGGGGVPLAARTVRQPVAAVVDKDYVAALLAVGLGAERLLFVTDVSHAFDQFGAHDQEAIHAMTVSEAHARLARGVFAPGSMAPKVESAVQFVVATRRPALITTIGGLAAALAGTAGTTIRPG